MKQSHAAIFAAFLFLTTAPVHAMCGGGGMDMGADTGASKGKAAGGMQCGGGMGGMKMDGMDMGEKKSRDTNSGDAKAADPHAGMDMGESKGDAKKADGCCCGCCGSMGGDGKTGGLCGKQANAATEVGKNDPLLTDPKWNKGKKPPQSHALAQT
jgi:hypothetical protein